MNSLKSRPDPVNVPMGLPRRSSSRSWISEICLSSCPFSSVCVSYRVFHSLPGTRVNKQRTHRVANYTEEWQRWRPAWWLMSHHDVKKCKCGMKTEPFGINWVFCKNRVTCKRVKKYNVPKLITRHATCYNLSWIIPLASNKLFLYLWLRPADGPVLSLSDVSCSPDPHSTASRLGSL